MATLSSPKPKSLKPDAQELILCDSPAYACETYIFDPSTGEEHLGYLFAAAETEDRGGVGKELLDMVMTAIQNEYYRDPSRNPVHSFELALHQANLILHDAAERGVRDWMGYFNVTVGILTGEQLHVSVAGEASCWLVRKGVITNISDGLSHLPITNPLRTFSQVASGEVKSRDTIFLATANFEAAFRPQDAARFTIDHSAQTIVARLQQLYRDQNHTTPLSLVAVTVLPEYVVQPKQEAGLPPINKARAGAALTSDQLKPRKPLVISRPGWKQSVAMATGLMGSLGGFLKAKLWPAVKQSGSVAATGALKGGTALWNISKQTGEQIASRRRAVAPEGLPTDRVAYATPKVSLVQKVKHGLGATLDWLRKLPFVVVRGVLTLPMTSKIFAGLALVLLIVLILSLHFLQSKRVADQAIQQAAEELHDAQTKVSAANSALLNDNRSQADSLLQAASKEADTLAASNLYVSDTKQLRADISEGEDKLQKITRVGSNQVLGDFSDKLSGATPTSLFWVDGKLYTFNPQTNAIVSMDSSGTTTVVSNQTQGIGNFVTGVAQSADKTILLATADAGVALFDTKAGTLSKQTIQLAGDKPSITALAAFGNRMYTYEPALKNIVVYNKTLRGFSSGTPWITDGTFPAADIKSFGVDGSVYTLQNDGSLHLLFKGQAADFTADSVSPVLTSATRLFTNDSLKDLYILDPVNKRVVIFTKKGLLIRQIFFAADADLHDVAVDDAETTLYVLDGTKVLTVPLTNGIPTATPTP